MLQRLYQGFPDFAVLQGQFLAGRVALFLDVDGTLLEIARRPDAVRVTEPLRALLRSLLQFNGDAVALVSGRSLAGLDELFAPLAFPAAGLHGVERRSASGIIHTHDFSATLGAVRALLSANSHTGLLVEDKRSAIVLHYREHPEYEPRARALATAALREAGAGWEIVPGKMSLELRVAHIGKQHALEAFMTEPPFAGRIPVFFGDDVTDEDAFDYVNEHAGWSVHIGEGPSCACRSLPDPLAVWRVLRALHP
jgi:trehalose 6-phosphate phosphatase